MNSSLIHRKLIPALFVLLAATLVQACDGAPGSLPITAQAPVISVVEDAPLPVDLTDKGDDGDIDHKFGPLTTLNASFAEDDAAYRDALVERSGFPALETGTVEQARGIYDKGTLVNASALPDEGAGYIKIFRSRNRPWGTLDIATLFQTAAATLKSRFPESERLQVGDIANKDGGQADGHSSHQNGLDMDIVYYRVNRQESLDATSFVESFVKDGKVTANFDTARNWELLKFIVATQHVNRIFVDQAIKKEFCRFSKSNGEYAAQIETLRRLRPWPLHDDHFHLRITCPKLSPKCEVQAEPSSGSGC